MVKRACYLVWQLNPPQANPQITPITQTKNRNAEDFNFVSTLLLSV